MKLSHFTWSARQIPKLIAISAITLTQQCVAEAIECRKAPAWGKNETDENWNIQDHYIKKSGQYRIGSCTLEIKDKEVKSINCKRWKSWFFPNLDLN